MDRTTGKEHQKKNERNNPKHHSGHSYPSLGKKKKEIDSRFPIVRKDSREREK
jgi:hypothetical protein